MDRERKLERLQRTLGADTCKELDALDKKDLECAIIVAEKAMKEAKDDLDKNDKYQDLKESMKAMSAGLKEVNKRQRALIQYSLLQLEGDSK